MNTSDKIRDEIEALADSDGKTNPHAIVKWAKENRNSALHGQFQWDKTKAAYEHWVETARRLIRIHVITPEGERNTVSLSIDRKSGGGYRSVSDVLSAPDLYEVMLTDALTDLNRVRAKYERIKELKPIWRELDRVASKATRKRVNGKHQPEARVA